jgi:prepilin-type N-terminal cleavage/methylation domain-containing protein
MAPHPRHPGWTTGGAGLKSAGSNLHFEMPFSRTCRLTNHQSSIINHHSMRGFSLLELLVAMSLMVVVASCLYSSLYTGFRAYRSARAAVDPTSTAINVIELLKQDIRGVLPPGSHLAGAFIGTDSGGLKGVDTDSLEFYTTHVFLDDTQLIGTTADIPVVGGIGKVNLLLEEDSETRDDTYLLLREVTTDLLAAREIQPQEQILCRGVVSLNLRYFDGADWLDEWDSTADANSLPLAVEIDLEVAHPDKHSQEPQKRRLVESFAIPCQAAAATESGTATGGTSSSGSASSGPSGGGASGSGASASGAKQ